MMDGTKGHLGRCRSCGAPVRWVRTARGKAMPLDADPAGASPPREPVALAGDVVQRPLAQEVGEHGAEGQVVVAAAAPAHLGDEWLGQGAPPQFLERAE